MKIVDGVKLVSFAITMSSAILILTFGMMLESTTAAHTIAGTSLRTIFIICLSIWIAFALVLLAICVFHAFSRPDIALLHLISVLAVLGFCATYVQLDPQMIQVWGPFAVDLGIALSTGARSAYRHVDGSRFRTLVDSFLPQNRRHGADESQGIPLTNFHAPPHGPHNV